MIAFLIVVGVICCVVVISRSKKINPEELYQSVAQKVVLSALQYRGEIKVSNNKLSADAGAEVIYLLLHLLDRQAFALGPTQRDTIYDKISQKAISDYIGATLKPNTRSDIVTNLYEQMMSTLNLRQIIYAQCTSLVGEMFPGQGSMVFAFGYFVHHALGRTTRDNIDDILTDKRKMVESEVDDFPSLSELVQTAVLIGSMIKLLPTKNDLMRLK